jgi:hypothetical protein
MFYNCPQIKVSQTEVEPDEDYVSGDMYLWAFMKFESVAPNATYNMFYLTGGLFTGSPQAVNNVYYTIGVPVGGELEM